MPNSDIGNMLLSDALGRIDTKLDRIDARLDEQQRQLDKQNASLEYHIKRTDLLEEALEADLAARKKVTSEIATKEIERVLAKRTKRRMAVTSKVIGALAATGILAAAGKALLAWILENWQ